MGRSSVEGSRAREIGGRVLDCGDGATGFRARLGLESEVKEGSGCAYALFRMLFACEEDTFCVVGKTSLRYLISAGFILWGGGGGAFLLAGPGDGCSCFSGSDLKSGAERLYDLLE